MTAHLCHVELQPLPAASSLTTPPRGEEGDGDSCSICFEAWTTAGEHRLSALRCGHIFGFTCIQRWLKAQGSAAKCPQVSRSPGCTLDLPHDETPESVSDCFFISVSDSDSISACVSDCLCLGLCSATRKPDVRTLSFCTHPS